MWTKIRAVILVFLLAVAITPIGAESVRADEFWEKLCKKPPKSEKDNPEYDLAIAKLCILHALDKLFSGALSAPDHEQAATTAGPIAFVERMINVGAIREAGEPTEGGTMTRTVWTRFKSPDASRIVIHTFGSEIWEGDSVFDTVLAVYRGTALDNLTRVAGNDNTVVPGIGNKHSLVQFNTVAGADYWVQIGSRANAEGEISLNVFRFPPSGGLSAFLIEYERQPVQQPRLFVRTDHHHDQRFLQREIHRAQQHQQDADRHPVYVARSGCRRTSTVLPRAWCAQGRHIRVQRESFQ